MSIKRSSVDIERWLIAQKIIKDLHEMIVKKYLDEKIGKNVIFEVKNHIKFDKMELS